MRLSIIRSKLCCFEMEILRERPSHGNAGKGSRLRLKAADSIAPRLLTGIGLIVLQICVRTRFFAATGWGWRS